VDEGERCVAFINRLWLIPSGQKLQQFKLRPWQEHMVRELFGTINPETNKRQFTDALWTMAKKNGKSGLVAAIVVYCLFAGFPAGSEIYSIAASKEQAAILYREVVNFITNTADFASRCHCSDQYKRISIRKGKTRGTVYEALSAEKSTAHGKKPSLLLIDEAAYVDADLWLTLEGSMGTQPEPLTIAISHATTLNREHIYQQRLSVARKVRDSRLPGGSAALNIPTLHVAIWELPLEMDWKDESLWHLANPALGDLKSLASMRKGFEMASRLPSESTKFRTEQLNQFTESDETWLFDKDVTACAMSDDPKAVLERFKERPAFVGLDLSSVEDLTCACLLFPPKGDEAGPTAFFAFFHPREGHEQRSEKDGVNYGVWAEQGYIELTDGRTVDYEAVRRRINAWSADFRIIQVGYDKRFAADLIKRLSEIDGFDCVDIGQGFAHLTSPSQAIEKQVLNHTLRHDSNPILAWNFANCCVQRGHGDEIFPSKMRSNGRIDGVVALVMAQYCNERNPNVGVDPTDWFLHPDASIYS
jgi:phage terminase large subunit-like protein